MNIDSITLILSSTGVIQTVFLAVYIFSAKKITKSERLLLGSLLLSIAVRLIKSIGWYFFQYEAMVFLNIGFAAHCSIGPLLFLYFSRKSHFTLTAWQTIAILALPLILLGASPLLELSSFWYRGGYMGLLYFTLICLIGCGVLLRRIISQNKIYFPWYRNLFIAVSIFCLSYFTNFIFGINSYISGPVIYSVVIYGISFVLFTNQEIFTPLGDKKKYKNINLSEEQIAIQKSKIEGVMQQEKPYLKNDFSLTELSQLTFIPKHLLSRFFSESLHMSFTDYTNEYRIKEAKKMLTHPNYTNLKIASIAYDCGFNSISTFNTAFKKAENLSPSQFRKLNIDVLN